MEKRKNSPSALQINTHPVLPKHFADQVLEFETELDLNCSINTVLKLMELYSVRNMLVSHRAL